MKQEIVIIASVAGCAIVAGLLVYNRLRLRVDPESLRRQRIDAHGRVIEGMVTDWHAGVVIYRWSWRGVEYEASQDLRSLAHLLPGSEDELIGPVTVKFLAKDPSNSIVMSESWNGFRPSPTRFHPRE
jgi:hypothetical protein